MDTPTPPTPQPDDPSGALTVVAEAVDELVEDFDAWRQQQKSKRAGGRRVRVFGKVVALPSSIPLGLTIGMDTLADSAGLEDVQEIVGVLYGKGALDHWIAEGVDLDDFQVLMAWGIASASGQNISFDRARELVAEAETKKAAKPGKARGGKKKRKRR